MLRPHLTKSRFASTLVLSAALANATLFATERTARAEDACRFRGEPALAPGVAIYDAATGGTEIAHFNGAKVGLSVSISASGKVDGDAASGRLAVETDGFRIKGYVRSRDLPFFTLHPVPVYPGHLSIAEGRRVAVVGATVGRVRVEKTTTTPFVGTFAGSAPCDALSLEAHVGPGWTPPGGAHGYVMRKDRIELFADANADSASVGALARAGDAPAVLFWSNERKGPWVHVEQHGELLVDAWARAADLNALPPGETIDQLAPATTVASSQQLRLQGTSKTIRTTAPVVLRSIASDVGVAIGGIDPGIDVLVLDVVAGWAKVLPAKLEVSPSGRGEFWARAKDLGL